MSQAEGDPARGLLIIRQLCLDSPINLQDYIDLLCSFVRQGEQEPGIAWNLEGCGTVGPDSHLFTCSLPRYDRNNRSYNLDLGNSWLTDLTLQRLNLENAALCDSVIHKVDFARSSLKNSDLRGSVFEHRQAWNGVTSKEA